MVDALLFLAMLAGIGLVVLVNRMLGGWRPARLADADAARRRYREDFWEDRIEAIALSEDGRAALLALGEPSALGLVLAHGAGFVTRRLESGDVRDVAIGAERRSLGLRLADFTLPRLRIKLAPEEAAAWAARLERLRTPEAVAAKTG